MSYPQHQQGMVYQPAVQRLNELLEAVKQEFFSISSETSAFLMQKDEHDHQVLTQHANDLQQIRKTIYELEVTHRKMKEQYEEEIMRLKRQLDQWMPPGAGSNAQPPPQPLRPGPPQQGTPQLSHPPPQQGPVPPVAGAANAGNGSYYSPRPANMGPPQLQQPQPQQQQPQPQQPQQQQPQPQQQQQQQQQPQPSPQLPPHGVPGGVGPLAVPGQPGSSARRSSSGSASGSPRIRSLPMHQNAPVKQQTSPRVVPGQTPPQTHAPGPLGPPPNTQPHQNHGQPLPPPLQAGGQAQPPYPQQPPPQQQSQGVSQLQPPPQQLQGQQVVQGPPAGGPPGQQLPPPPRAPGGPGFAPLGNDLAFLDPENVAPEFIKRSNDWHVLYNEQAPRKIDVDLVQSLKHDSVVCCVRFSMDGKYLATGCNRSAQIFDVNTGQMVCKLMDTSVQSEDDLYIRSVCFSSDSKLLATGAEDHDIRIWDIASREIIHVFSGHEQDIYSLDISRSGKHIASGSGDGTVRIWELDTKECISVLRIDGGVTAVGISGDGRYVAAGSLDHMVRVWEIATGYLVEQLEGPDGHQDSVYSVTFGPNGKDLVSGSLDKTIKYWELKSLVGQAPPRTAVCKRTIIGHKDFVLSVAMTPDGNWIISGSKDRGVQFWDPQTGQSQLMLQAHNNSVISVAPSPVGMLFVTGSGDFWAKIWRYYAV